MKCHVDCGCGMGIFLFGDGYKLCGDKGMNGMHVGMGGNGATFCPRATLCSTVIVTVSNMCSCACE